MFPCEQSSHQLLERYRLFHTRQRYVLPVNHDDVIKWKHFPHNWPFVRGIQRSPVNSPHKGQWRGALMLSLIWVWINDWVNNREAGDLRRYRAHYDVIVMSIVIIACRKLQRSYTVRFIYTYRHQDWYVVFPCGILFMYNAYTWGTVPRSYWGTIKRINKGYCIKLMCWYYICIF